MNMPQHTDALPRFANIERIIEKLKPLDPLYVIFPEKFRVAAKRFLDSFPGDTLYAVKANPAPHVLDQVYGAGIRHFDTASLAEIELVHDRYPEAQCHFMAPVRAPGAAKIAFEKHGCARLRGRLRFRTGQAARRNERRPRTCASSCASRLRSAARCWSFPANSARRPTMRRGC